MRVRGITPSGSVAVDVYRAWRRVLAYCLGDSGFFRRLAEFEASGQAVDNKEQTMTDDDDAPLTRLVTSEMDAVFSNDRRKGGYWIGRDCVQNAAFSLKRCWQRSRK